MINWRNRFIRPVVVWSQDDRAARAAVGGLSLVLVVSVAAALAGLTWRITGLDDGRDRVALATGGPKPGAAVSDIAPILALAPFGGSAATAPVSAEGMVLRAVFMAYPAAASSALVSIGDAPAVSIMLGQTLSTGAIVDVIGMDYVLLNVGGRSERLEFPRPPTADGAAPVTQAAQAVVAVATPTLAPSTAPAAPASTSGSGIPPSVVEQYRQRLDTNPQQVAGELGVTATAGGYRVGDNPAPELLAAGLQPGDVVEKVNNQAVGSVGGDRRIVDQAITSGGARVEVLRNGRRLTLSFPLR